MKIVFILYNQNGLFLLDQTKFCTTFVTVKQPWTDGSEMFETWTHSTRCCLKAKISGAPTPEGKHI